jgi:hypothetical protein
MPLDIFESSFIRQNLTKVRAAVDTVPLIPATSIVEWTRGGGRFGPQAATAKWTQGNHDLQFTFAISGTGREITELMVEPKKPARITDAESRVPSEASQSPTNAYPWLSGSFKGDWATKFAASFGPGSAVPQDGSVTWWKHTKESMGQSEDVVKATWLLCTGEKLSRTMYERDKDGKLQQWDLKGE